VSTWTGHNLFAQHFFDRDLTDRWARLRPMNDPFAHLETVEQIEAAERKARQAYPWLWRLAELVIFARNPVRGVRHWRDRRRIGYDGRPR